MYTKGGEGSAGKASRHIADSVTKPASPTDSRAFAAQSYACVCGKKSTPQKSLRTADKKKIDKPRLGGYNSKVQGKNGGKKKQRYILGI